VVSLCISIYFTPICLPDTLLLGKFGRLQKCFIWLLSKQLYVLYWTSWLSQSLHLLQATSLRWSREAMSDF
jgi:hypothetical protein